MRKFEIINEFDKPRDDEVVTLTMREVRAIYEALSRYYTGSGREAEIPVHEKMQHILRSIRKETKD